MTNKVADIFNFYEENSDKLEEHNDLCQIEQFTTGLSYLRAWGMIDQHLGLEADHDIIYVNIKEWLLDDTSIRHIVSLGFHYEDENLLGFFI